MAFLLQNNHQRKTSASYVTKPNRACKVVSSLSLAFSQRTLFLAVNPGLLLCCQTWELFRLIYPLLLMKKNLATLFVFPSLAVFVHQSNQLSFMGTINTQPELFCFYHKLGYMKLSFSLYFFYQKKSTRIKLCLKMRAKTCCHLKRNLKNVMKKCSKVLVEKHQKITCSD